jgi:hypothetical protein
MLDFAQKSCRHTWLTVLTLASTGDEPESLIKVNQPGKNYEDSPTPVVQAVKSPILVKQRDEKIALHVQQTEWCLGSRG